MLSPLGAFAHAAFSLTVLPLFLLLPACSQPCNLRVQPSPSLRAAPSDVTFSLCSLGVPFSVQRWEVLSGADLRPTGQVCCSLQLSWLRGSPGRPRQDPTLAQAGPGGSQHCRGTCEGKWQWQVGLGCREVAGQGRVSWGGGRGQQETGSDAGGDRHTAGATWAGWLLLPQFPLLHHREGWRGRAKGGAVGGRGKEGGDERQQAGQEQSHKGWGAARGRGCRKEKCGEGPSARRRAGRCSHCWGTLGLSRMWRNRKRPGPAPTPWAGPGRPTCPTSPAQARGGGLRSLGEPSACLSLPVCTLESSPGGKLRGSPRSSPWTHREPPPRGT